MRITSSSTSSSEASWSASPWRGFSLIAVTVAAGLALLLWTALLALDPYDTGRFRPPAPPRLVDQGSRTGHASRARDPAFDGALIGNSHLQLVDPAALSRDTGVPFVSLAVVATGPREQLAVLDWFLRHRARPVRALVFGADDYWCTADPGFTHPEPFPFWLYGLDPWRYAAGLFRYGSFEAAIRRLRERTPARARRDGFVDLEADPRWRAAARGFDLETPRPSPLVGLSGRFPMIEALAARLDRLPAAPAIVLVRPPVYRTALPALGSRLARAEEACRAALADLARSRPRTELVDWRRERPETGDPADFFDHTHYRGRIARALEAEIAAALRRALAGEP